MSSLPDLDSNRNLLRALREHGFAGEIAIVARDEAQGMALKQYGAPTVLYPLRNAVDYVVESLTAIIRQEKTP